MRLHELSITAFGPFVDTVVVDFDELASTGLFLLTGDTGAGKTSVLDAICFALYGEVPGDRHSARHLRSDQADASAEPLVVLSFSIGDRSFRFTRSPAWDRPKRRGVGSVRVQAHVLVEELRDGDWVLLSNRLDESGQLVTSLLGMTCTQFTQVAMLPQGRFQAFLRASSAERHAVLQRLFRTRRFEEVERWLTERRGELRRRSQVCHDRAAGVVNRIQEAAGTAVPTEWEMDDLDPIVDDGSLHGWTGSLTAETASRHVELTAALAGATELHHEATSAWEDGRQTARARERGESARTALEDLDRTADDEAALAASLDAHRRAGSVLQLALRTEQATSSAAEAKAAADERAAGVAELLGLPADQVRPLALSDAARTANEARAVAESWLPRERELHDERARLRSLAAQLARLERQIAAHEEEHERIGEQRAQLGPLLSRTRVAANALETHRAALAAATAGLAAAQQVRDLTPQLATALERLAGATEKSQRLREQHLDLREQRISGMAAELAGSLAVGCSCPVCGSAQHPAPATAATPVSRADEDAARQEHEDAEFERQTVRELVSALEAQLEAARLRSHGEEPEHWLIARDAASAGVDDATRAGVRVGSLEAELVGAEDRDRILTAELASARATREARIQQQVDSQRRSALLAAELDGLLAGHPEAGSVASLVELHTERVSRLEHAASALTAHERAVHELDLAAAAAQEAAQAAGFGSLDDALRAVLPGERAAAGVAELDARRARRTAATNVLDEPDVAAALSQAAPDLTALAEAARTAGAERDRVHADHQHAATRVARMTALCSELGRELKSWDPVRREHAVVAGLASLVEGRSADNQLKMRLSAYVLSERLRQVVASANERLAQMTDERFTLEQTDEKGAGEQRGGLSLRVRDEWSGKHRDPATLSGGETFLVSLALALGLADTVTHEAGGTQLDSLFIDEGFGALDAATLDGVMDTLDALRDGGRVVGLVSHVAELRNRVPAQLEVHKARRGSTLRAHLMNS